MIRRMATWLIIVLVVFVPILLFAVVSVLPIAPASNEDAVLGYTFSIRAAEALGLDWREAYRNSLKDLNPKVIRLPVYWDRLQPAAGAFDWTETDEQMAALVGTDTKVILAIGRKLPRWPECHVPGWVGELESVEAKQALREMLSEVVRRYQGHEALNAWQVENEALFPFGECPLWSKGRSLLREEVDLVRSIDTDHDVYTTDSGELSLWLRTTSLPIDGLGISLYRVVYDTKYRYWPVNPYFYRLRMRALKPFVGTFLISELQMEPWGPRPVQELSTSEAYRSFSPIDVASRIDFARRTGADTILAWGVEWWYYMHKQNLDQQYWQEAIRVFNP